MEAKGSEVSRLRDGGFGIVRRWRTMMWSTGRTLLRMPSYRTPGLRVKRLHTTSWWRVQGRTRLTTTRSASMADERQRIAYSTSRSIPATSTSLLAISLVQPSTLCSVSTRVHPSVTYTYQMLLCQRRSRRAASISRTIPPSLEHLPTHNNIWTRGLQEVSACS